MDPDEVVECACGSKEYYGKMTWHNGIQYCRECIYGIWESETNYKWQRRT